MKSIEKVFDLLKAVVLHPQKQYEILKNWQEETREDQRKKCADEWWLWFKGKKKGQPMEIILSAGKGKTNEQNIRAS